MSRRAEEESPSLFLPLYGRRCLLFSLSLSFFLDSSRTFLAEVVFERTVAFLRKWRIHAACPHAVCHHFPSSSIMGDHRDRGILILLAFGGSGRAGWFMKDASKKYPLSHEIGTRELQVFVEKFRKWSLRHASRMTNCWNIGKNYKEKNHFRWFYRKTKCSFQHTLKISLHVLSTFRQYF